MRGIGRVLPFVGISYTLCILALNGMPPMTGFISEIFIARAGIDLGGVGLLFVSVMLANIVLSIGYYVPSINTIMFSEEQGVKVTGVRPVPRLMQAMILVATALIIILGIFPQVGLAIVSPAAAYLYHQFFPV